jgi:dTMP kinase
MAGQSGKFVVFEGGEGSGKDTQIELLRVQLPDAVFTKEPGGTAIGTELRRLLLDWRGGYIDPLAELLLFSASRVHFMEEVIRPALTEGKTVVANRFALSTIAYQVYGRERPGLLEVAHDIYKKVVHEHTPDLVILLDLDPKVGLERVLTRGDGQTRFDAESLAFHERVRTGYHEHIASFGPHAIINAAQSPSDVAADIVRALKAHGIL